MAVSFSSFLIFLVICKHKANKTVTTANNHGDVSFLHLQVSGVASPSPSPAWKWWRPHCSWTRWSETLQTSPCTVITSEGKQQQHYLNVKVIPEFSWKIWKADGKPAAWGELPAASWAHTSSGILLLLLTAVEGENKAVKRLIVACVDSVLCLDCVFILKRKG